MKVDEHAGTRSLPGTSHQVTEHPVGTRTRIQSKITGHKTEAVYRRYAIVNEADVAEGLGRLAKWLG